jgi:NitT/TauT family transport system ATP-binding protein
VLERLREQQPAARRWLHLLALDAAGYRGMMIRAHNIRKQFATKSGTVRGIEDISLDVGKGEFVTIFGPNGCGKSTLVNIIAGLLEADSGMLASDYGSLAAIRKCYVWQNYRDALLPWRSVSENISFPLKISGAPKQQRRRQVEELMHRFGITLGPDSRVYSLSGGEQQIVSILRGLIIEPEIMLLDEPFSALDYQMNLVMEAKIMEIWAKTKITTVFVSHDLDQAILLADRIVLLSRGPSHVRQIFENPLPRPRTVDMLGHPQHVALKKQILEFFQGDAL